MAIIYTMVSGKSSPAFSHAGDKILSYYYYYYVLVVVSYHLLSQASSFRLQLFPYYV